MSKPTDRMTTDARQLTVSVRVPTPALVVRGSTSTEVPAPWPSPVVDVVPPPDPSVSPGVDAIVARPRGMAPLLDPITMNAAHTARPARRPPARKLTDADPGNAMPWFSLSSRALTP